MRLHYVIKFVADMNRAVAFHRDALGLKLRFTLPEWSEFDTGTTTLALHPADERHPAGTCQLGFGTEALDTLYAEREARGIAFAIPPADLHGRRIARFIDPDGAETSLSS